MTESKSGVVIVDNLVISFDDVNDYQHLDTSLVSRKVKTLVAKSLGWSVLPSWLSTSRTLDGNGGDLFTSLRIDTPTIIQSRRIASILKKWVAKDHMLVATADVDADVDADANKRKGKTTMRLLWRGGGGDGSASSKEGGITTTSIRAGAAPWGGQAVASSSKRKVNEQKIRERVQQMAEATSEVMEKKVKKVNATTTSSATNVTKKMKKKKGEGAADWFEDVANNEAYSPSKNSILTSTVWRGPQSASTYFSAVVDPVAAATRTADQARRDQKLAQRRQMAVELELETVELRETAIEQLLSAVRLMSEASGASLNMTEDNDDDSIFDSGVASMVAALTLHNLHGPKSVEDSLQVLKSAREKSLLETNQTTSDAEAAELELTRVTQRRMDTNPMEMVLVSEHDMMFSEVKEEKVEMSNILLEDKLFRDFSAARIMLKEIEQSLTTIPELDML